MKVLTLSEYGEDRFLSELERLKHANYKGDQRNAGWFNRIPEIYKTRFKEWFFLVDDNNTIAFATIQEFYPMCYRLLTRTYTYPEYRRFTLPDNDTKQSPSMYLLEAQMKYIHVYDTVFISMQDLKRRNSIDRYRKKLEDGWILHPEMVQTCNDNSSDRYQNVIYKGKELQRPTITIDEWKQRYD